MYRYPGKETHHLALERPIPQAPFPDSGAPSNRIKRETRASKEAAFRDELSRMLPSLTAFSSSLCKDRELAKDIAQETLLKAWQARTTFRPGTNLRAWLFAILRNVLHSHRRRAWRQVDPGDGEVFDRPGPEMPQEWAVHASDAVRALHVLPDAQRQALMLVGLGGFDCVEAAAIAGCEVGTLKSRVSRARKAIGAVLEQTDRLPGTLPPIGSAADAILAELERAARP